MGLEVGNGLCLRMRALPPVARLWWVRLCLTDRQALELILLHEKLNVTFKEMISSCRWRYVANLFLKFY